MQVKINGEIQEIEDTTTVADLLHQKLDDASFVAVALNKKALPKVLYGQTQLQEGDLVEILSPMSGG